MGHVTRHEVTQMIKQFEDKVIPKESLMQLGMPGLLLSGISAVKYELDHTQGVPSVKLRNFARVLKHYLEAPKDPRNVYYFNHVISQVAMGIDPTKAIKRARSECDPAKAEARMKKSLKQMFGNEQQATAVA